MTRIAWFCLPLAVWATSGCGGTPSPPASAPTPRVARSAKAPADSPPAAEPRIKITQDLFPDVPTAVTALRDGLSENDKDTVLKAEGWLALQRDKAVGPLTQVLQAEDVSPEIRITACRALGRVGPAATAVLLETSASESLPEQLKIKATESLSVVRPTSQTIVDRLTEIVRGDDQRMRQVAIQGLGRIGPAAKSATDVLVETLNDTSQSETIRGEAKRALKEVDPRHGLMGIAPRKK